MRWPPFEFQHTDYHDHREPWVQVFGEIQENFRAATRTIIESIQTIKPFREPVADALNEFVVKLEKYIPERIFKQSVIHRSVDGYNCFLLTNQGAVEQVTREHATRLTETDLDHPFLTVTVRLRDYIQGSESTMLAKATFCCTCSISTVGSSPG